MKKLILTLFIILFWVNLTWSATYYMRADGTAANKAAATGPCGTIGNCMSMATHNGETFSGDDIIYLCDDGGGYRAELTIPSSGTSGHQITYQNAIGDTPVVRGDDLITPGTSWANDSGDIWKADFAAEVIPGAVWFDGTKGTVQANKAACNGANKWFWDANVLYVYSTSDPDTAYTDPGIEVSIRAQCIYIYQKDYVTIDGINSMRAGTTYEGSPYGRGVRVYDGQYFVLQNFTTSYNGDHGVVVTNGSNYGTITNVISHDNVTGGIWIQDGANDHHTISYCTTYNNVVGIVSHENSGSTDGPEDVTISHCTAYSNSDDGIALSSFASNSTVEYCEAYGNGVDATGSQIAAASSGGKMSGNIIRYNYMHDGGADAFGLKIYNQTGIKVYHNLIDTHSGRGIDVSTVTGGEIENNDIYNCTGAVSDGAAIRFVAVVTTPVTVKNNITHTTARVFQFEADPTGQITSDYNSYYNYSGAFAQDSSGDITNYTFAEWRTAFPTLDANSINGSDPKFVSPATGDFYLQPTSPCINKGTNVGLTQDYTGAVIPRGAGYDIGAYEYLLGSGAQRQIIGGFNIY